MTFSDFLAVLPPSDRLLSILEQVYLLPAFSLIQPVGPVARKIQHYCPNGPNEISL